MHLTQNPSVKPSCLPMIQEHMPTCSLIQSRDFSRIADLNESIPSYANIPLALTWQCLKYYRICLSNSFEKPAANFSHLQCSYIWVVVGCFSSALNGFNMASWTTQQKDVESPRKKVAVPSRVSFERGLKWAWLETVPILTLLIIFPEKNNLRICYVNLAVWRLQINFNGTEFC